MEHGDTHTTEHALYPMAKCFEPTDTHKEPPPLLPQPSLLSCGAEQPNSSIYGRVVASTD